MGWLSAIIGIVLTIIFLSLIYLGYNALWCALVSQHGILGIAVFLIFFIVTLVPLIFLIILSVLPAIWGIAWD